MDRWLPFFGEVQCKDDGESWKCKAVEKVEMVTASWQSCKAKPVRRNSPDSGFVLASEYTGHLVVAATIVALDFQAAVGLDSTCLAAKADLDTFCRVRNRKIFVPVSISVQPERFVFALLRSDDEQSAARRCSRVLLEVAQKKGAGREEASRRLICSGLQADVKRCRMSADAQ